jgi:hypothetical protein
LFQRPIPASCAGHILGNVRTSAAVSKTQRNFHQNLFWAIQGSESQGELISNLERMNIQFPSVVEYLSKIDATMWIWFSQVSNGRSMFQWRTSNMAENSQSCMDSPYDRARRQHPLNAFAFFVASALKGLNAEAEDLATWSANDYTIVPYAKQLLDEVRQDASLCNVSGSNGT